MTIVTLSGRDDIYFSDYTMAPITDSPIDPPLECKAGSPHYDRRQNAREFGDANIGSYLTYLSKPLTDVRGVRFCWLNMEHGWPVLPLNYRFFTYTDSTGAVITNNFSYNVNLTLNDINAYSNNIFDWGADHIEIWNDFTDGAAPNRFYINYETSTFANAGGSPRLDLTGNPFLAAFFGLRATQYDLPAAAWVDGNSDEKLYFSYPPDPTAGQRALWVSLNFGEPGEMITTGGARSPSDSFIVVPMVFPNINLDTDQRDTFTTYNIFYEEPERSKMIYKPSSPLAIDKVSVEFFTCVQNTWVPVDFNMINWTMKLEVITEEDLIKKRDVLF
jgi:hypothetical protein